MNHTTIEAAQPPPRRAQIFAWLIPMSSGSGEIASLDGLRALAALGVMVFHSYYVVSKVIVIGGVDVTYLGFFAQTGVHLFFVLSGFLLFTPFARAMLEGRPLPSAKRFYQRRALRILPAYWVCLAVLVAFYYQQYLNLAGLQNIGWHILMLHDDFYYADHAINGPFWTLAVEAQFYLVLPLLAWAISKFVGATRSRLRLLIGIVVIILGALALRSVDAAIHDRYFNHTGLVANIANRFVQFTLGIQGKYIEVFALGMLCSALYLTMQDERRRLRRRLPLIGVALVGVAALAWPMLAQLATTYSFFAPFVFWRPFDWLAICGPLLAGLPYAALTIGVLWAPKWLRAVFEVWPLRWIGLISYSLYLWHLPVLELVASFTPALPANARIGIELLAGFLIAVPIAYISYQLIERPFLARRQRMVVARGTKPEVVANR